MISPGVLRLQQNRSTRGSRSETLALLLHRLRRRVLVLAAARNLSRDPTEPGRPHFTYTSSRNREAAEQERDRYGVTRTSLQTRIFCSRGKIKYKSIVLGAGGREGGRQDVRQGKTDVLYNISSNAKEGERERDILPLHFFSALNNKKN